MRFVYVMEYIFTIFKEQMNLILDGLRVLKEMEITPTFTLAIINCLAFFAVIYINFFRSTDIFRDRTYFSSS